MNEERTAEHVSEHRSREFPQRVEYTRFVALFPRGLHAPRSFAARMGESWKREIFMPQRNNPLIFVLTLGVFAILNTEMGVIGLLPFIADKFHISVSEAGLLVSLF